MDKKKFPAILFVIGGQVLNIIIEKKGITYEEAVKLFYPSKLYEALESEESKVWHFSPETLYSLLEEELATGKITFPEEQ